LTSDERLHIPKLIRGGEGDTPMEEEKKFGKGIYRGPRKNEVSMGCSCKDEAPKENGLIGTAAT